MRRTAALAMLSLAAVACGQTTSYAVPSSPERPAIHGGPIAVYAMRDPAGRELGVVEARGFGESGTIDHLIPELVRRARSLGADAVVIDWIGLSVDVIDTVVIDGSALCTPVACATPAPRLQPQEIASIRVRGRAFRVAP